MRLEINREELLSLMKDFYKFTNIRIVVFDEEFVKIAAYPAGHAKFCRELRTDAEALRRCKECDDNACMTAKRTKSAYIYKCHAGLTEAVSPITVDGRIVGYIMLGQILQVEDKKEAWDRIKEYISGYDLDIKKMEDLYKSKKNYSRSRIVSASKIMEACAAYLILSQMIVFNEDTAAKELDDYIKKNIFNRLDVEKICRDLQISRVRLYDISQRSYGMGIAEYIRKTRVDAAGKLLIKSNERISEIADKCAFPDYNYFTKVFKRYTGLTPRDYRKRYAGRAGLK